MRVVRSFGCGSAFIRSNKEAANSSTMTFTLFATRHFPKCRSARRNGYLHRLA